MTPWPNWKYVRKTPGCVFMTYWDAWIFQEEVLKTLSLQLQCRNVVICRNASTGPMPVQGSKIVNIPVFVPIGERRIWAFNSQTDLFSYNRKFARQLLKMSLYLRFFYRILNFEGFCRATIISESNGTIRSIFSQYLLDPGDRGIFVLFRVV